MESNVVEIDELDIKRRWPVKEIEAVRAVLGSSKKSERYRLDASLRQGGLDDNVQGLCK